MVKKKSLYTLPIKDIDIVVYNISPPAFKHSSRLAQFLAYNYGQRVFLHYAIRSKDEHLVTRERRITLDSIGKTFDESIRHPSIGAFGDSEMLSEQGNASKVIPNSKGIPIILVSQPYTEEYVVDQELRQINAAVQKIRSTNDRNPIWMLPLDMPYVLSHGRTKYMEKGHDHAEHLQGVITGFRQMHLDLLITMYCHAQNETLDACLTQKPMFYGIPQSNLPPLNYLDIDPFGKMDFNGKSIYDIVMPCPNMLEGGMYFSFGFPQGNDGIQRLSGAQRFRNSVFPFKALNQELSKRYTIRILPDEGQQKRTLGNNLPTIYLSKIRWHEGKITINIGENIFDFEDYLKTNLKGGDTLTLLFEDDFVKTGGTSNKTTFDIKELILNAANHVYGHGHLPITLETVALIPHYRTVDSETIRMHNLDRLYMLDTHPISPNIFSEMVQRGFGYARTSERHIMPDAFSPAISIGDVSSSDPGFAAAIMYAGNKLNLLNPRNQPGKIIEMGDIVRKIWEQEYRFEV